MNSQLFLDAAELIETGESWCCCYAIARLERSGAEHEIFFSAVLAPVLGIDFTDERGDYDAYWLRMGCTEDEARERRVLALCFAATLAADGYQA